MTNVPAAYLVADDVGVVDDAIEGMHVTRLDRGRNQLELALVQVDSISLCVGNFGFRASSEAEFGEDEYRVGLQLENGSGSWNGEPFHPDTLWVYGPGSEHSGAGSPDADGRSATWATFTLPSEDMAGITGSTHAGRRGVHTVVNADLRSLRTGIRDVATLATNGALDTQQAVCAARELRQATTTVLADPVGDTPTTRSSYRITRECMAIADALNPIPTTAELAAALDVSDRWVRAAFSAVFGVSVSEFFRARALHRARRELQAADATSVSVAEIAVRCGFWHLGRFAGYYRRHFGEPPSATLRRRS